MIAIIGYPGSTNHRWERFFDKKLAVEWLQTTGQKMYEDSGNSSPESLYSQRVISEREAARIKYQDGTKCYPNPDLRG